MRVIGKLLILLLVFCIGFVSAFGALFGVGYYAYKNVSLDKAGVSTDSIFDKSIAEVDISNMTIEGLVSEIQALQGISDKLTLDTLISRYGVIVPEEVDSAIPVSARTLPLHQLFSQDGLMIILGDLYIGQLLSYEKGELKPGTDGEYYWYQPGTTNEVTGIYSVLVNYTVADLINQNFDVNMIMEDLTIATVLNLHDVTYSEAYIDGSAVTLEKEVRVWFNSDGAKVSSTIAALADIPVSKLSTSLDGVEVSSLLGYVEYSDDYYSYTTTNMDNKDVLVLTEQGGLTAELSDMTIADFSNGKIDEKINEIKIYTVLGYTYDEEDGKYYDQNGEAATGVTAVIAGFAIGEVGSEINNVMIGEVCGFTKVEGEDGEVTWYSEYYGENPEEGQENVKAEGIMAAMADLTINDLGDNDKLTDRINSVTVADALGYKETEDGFVDKNGDPVTGVIGVIAGEPLGGIQDKIDETAVGELCGYTKVGDDWYTTDEDGSERKVTGVMAAIADSTVDTIDQDIDNVLIGDVCGYISVKDDDGNVTWYTKYNGEDAEDNELATGVMGALASSSIGTIDEDINNVHIGEVCGYTKVVGEDEKVTWYSEYYGENDPRNVVAKGVMASMADSTIGNVDEDAENILIGDACGYTKVEDDDGNITWYTKYNGEDAEDNELATGVMAALAGSTVSTIDDDINDVLIGDVCGYTKVEDEWYSEYYGENDPRNVVAKGVMASMADSTIGNVDEDAENILIGDACGYTKVVEEDGTVNWYTKYNGEDAEDNELATGVMAALADSTVSTIDDDINDVLIGDVCGYTKVEDEWYSEYYGENDPRNVVAKGVMAAMADSTIGNVDEEAENILIGDACGYTKVVEDDGTVNWYTKYNGEDAEDNELATGVMAAIADSTIASIDEDINGVFVGEVCGYTKKDGVWYTKDEDGNEVEAEGVMAAMADLTIEQLGDNDAVTSRIETIRVADALGYTGVPILDEDDNPVLDENGEPMLKWYSEYSDDGDPKNDVEVTGVMSVIAGTKLNGIQGTVDEATIGEVTGFTKIGDTWYTDPEGTEEAGGIMNAIADLKVSELKEDGKLTECIEGLTVADALGYEKRGDDYYNDGVLVTGVMGVIAGTQLNNIQGAVDDSLTGELMGLTPVYAEDGETITFWKDDNGEPVHVLMNKIASTPFEDISGITDTLVISDIIPEEERDHGFISLINPNATIDQIPDEVDKLFNETEICQFVEKGVITFDKAEHKALFEEDGPFGHHSMTDLIGLLASILHSNPQLGQQSE